MQKTKHDLSIKVTKTFDQHDGRDQQLSKGVKTLENHRFEANTVHSYCEAIVNPCARAY